MRLYMQPILFIIMSLFPALVFSECAQYQIIDHGDRVEAICVGAPLSESEKRALSVADGQYRQNEVAREKSYAQQEIDRNAEELKLRKSREALVIQEREEKQRKESEERLRRAQKDLEDSQDRLKRSWR
jgi:flagellar motility protein MotE (MotC chaperone)